MQQHHLAQFGESDSALIASGALVLLTLPGSPSARNQRVLKDSLGNISPISRCDEECLEE